MALSSSDRLVSGAAALTVEALLVAMLLFGMVTGGPAQHATRDAGALTIVPVAPPPHAVAQEKPHRSGRPSPPNLRSRPTDVVQVVQPQPIVPPIVVAPIAGAGVAARAGAADIVGPGAGAGGSGNGTGSGGAGDGEGGGGTPPRLIKGEISDSDYPRDLWREGIGGTVAVRYHVEPSGRVQDCRVTGSSGNAELDSVTCRLIERRFRYAPARDEQDRPVESTIVENHSWVVDRLGDTTDPARPD